MEFKSQRAIYLQIADYLCDQILAGRYPEGEKLPSVRELATEVEVNVNTVARSFEWLQLQGVADVRRGMGNYVALGAKAAIEAIRRKEFFAATLPSLFREMQTLDITMNEVQDLYNKTLARHE